MKRACSGDMSLLAPYGTSSDAGHAYSMGHQQQRLEPKRPCYPDHVQLHSQAGFTNTTMYAQTSSFTAAPRSTPFSMQLQEPGAYQVPAAPAAVQPFMGLAATVNPAQVMAAGQPELQMPAVPLPGMQATSGSYMMQQQQQQQQQAATCPPQQQQQEQQQQQQQQQALQASGSSAVTQFAPPSLPHTSAAAAAAAPPGSLLAHQMRSSQHPNMMQQQQQQVPAGLRLAEDWRPLNELQRLLPRLNQEYKREMSLLLKACQVRHMPNKQQRGTATISKPGCSRAVSCCYAVDRPHAGVAAKLVNNCRTDFGRSRNVSSTVCSSCSTVSQQQRYQYIYVLVCYIAQTHLPPVYLHTHSR
jgi:hypothetical protein